MGWQIIKQPNGKYAVWSGITDSFHYFNLTPKQTLGIFLRAQKERHDEERQELKNKIPVIIDALDAGSKPYYQFTMSWDDALEMMEANHSKERVEKLREKVDKGFQTEDEDDGPEPDGESENSSSAAS